MAVDFVGIQTVEHLNRIFQLNNHEFSVSSDFKQAVSALKRSGHARFRRGPPVSSNDPQTPSVSSRSEEKLLDNPRVPSVSSRSEQKLPVESTAAVVKDGLLKKFVTDATASFQSPTSSSFASSFAGGSVEGSVSNGRQVSSLGIVAPAPSFSSRKPPLPLNHRKRHSTEMTSASLHGSGRENVSGTGCHCCKRRKTGSKRKIRRIPIIGSKVESIPADDYSWKKYGEKKVTGSPFPRVYYKCNSGEGCPARKRVELSLTDSKMLIVTYDREHRH
ncbi:putative transcription factor WRKY family [Helianthus annuus]|nr:putative transcription factor WRKY family [Helianthus annuus]KAJ0523153.1 putative transcription factor WRKY family [Helianthus annuus]KAJ0531002.1 putative transcription factor WRKY family [Helianthus annuus]KAJ0697852.1 putative transcription factor WRKY family [Helianthus annuus]KAJ0701221.1 putative transcription factor WRKY family [Helianthus annuus]